MKHPTAKYKEEKKKKGLKVGKSQANKQDLRIYIKKS